MVDDEIREHIDKISSQMRQTILRNVTRTRSSCRTRQFTLQIMDRQMSITQMQLTELFEL